jgi:hypothetical protein
MHNAHLIAEFGRYIVERKSALAQHYEKRLAYDLSKQQWDGCFQRNVLAVLESFYDDALLQLKTIPFDTGCSEIQGGRSALTAQVLAVFQGVIDDFLLTVVDRHRTSCALSNFPDEHKPDKTYINEVRRGIAELWKNFAIDTNRYFLEHR